MRSIGLDIHAAKPSYVYTDEGVVKSLKPDGLIESLQKEAQKGVHPLVVCDAPLTAPYLYSIKRALKRENKLTKRGIEYFFTRQDYGFNTHKIEGINVGEYSKLSHRTVVDYVFGLPQVDNIAKVRKAEITVQYTVLTEQPNDFETFTGPALTEIHPGVFMWLLLDRKEQGWTYKSDQKVFENIRDRIAERIPSYIDELHVENLRNIKFKDSKKDGDDRLDAFICWLAGKMYLKGSARIYGNKQSGSFLLPQSSELDDAFKKLMKSYSDDSV